MQNRVKTLEDVQFEKTWNLAKLLRDEPLLPPHPENEGQAAEDEEAESGAVLHREFNDLAI